MRKFWVIIVIIVLVLGVMVLLTYLSPEIKAYALKIATDRHLPLFIVGLFAPIAFLWKKFVDAIGNFLQGGTAADIENTNRQLQSRLDRIEQEVKGIDEWRKREIDAHREEIDALKKSIAEMSSKKAAIEQTIAQTEATPAVDFATGEKYEKYLDDSETDPNFIR